VLLGSVSAALVKAAPCPLLVHPRGVSVEARTAQSAEAREWGVTAGRPRI
jgi:hypothetical protein